MNAAENILHSIYEMAATYLGGEYHAMASASFTATLPEGTNCAVVHAEDGPITWSINSAADAGANSPGYVGEELSALIPKMSNLNTLKFYGVSPAKLHVEYFKA